MASSLKDMGNIKDFRAQLESKKFCFCLPVRLGVFVVSLITMLAGSIIAAMAWMQVAQQNGKRVEVTDQVAAYVHAAIFSMLGVLSVFGFVGSLTRVRGLVIAYSVGLALHLGLSIASGVFTMITIFRPNPAKSVESCIAEANPTPDLLEETRNICNTGMAVAKGIIVAIYVVSWILQLYGYFIVSRYSDQLEEEEMAKLAAIMPQQPHQPMSYVGYPHSHNRFSYGGYYEPRRVSYEDRYGRQEGPYPPQPYPPQGGQEQDQYQQDGRPQRPVSSEYGYQLPAQEQAPWNGGRGKDASNMA
jgi:hypothetical protein